VSTFTTWSDGSLREWLDSCAMIVDALLGTGTANGRSVAILANLLVAVRQAASAHRSSVMPDLVDPSRPVASVRSPLIVAVDGPTGLNYDTGEIDPLTLPADISVTFAYPKIGHTRFPGAGLCGELIVADIGPIRSWHRKIDRAVADPALIPIAFCRFAHAAPHKGTFGKVLHRFRFHAVHWRSHPCRRGAYRIGRRPCHAGDAAVDSCDYGEQDQRGDFPAAARSERCAERRRRLNQVARRDHELHRDADRTRANTNARSFIEQLLAQKAGRSALALDADALNILAQIDQWWTRVPSPAILTPHPARWRG